MTGAPQENPRQEIEFFVGQGAVDALRADPAAAEALMISKVDADYDPPNIALWKARESTYQSARDVLPGVLLNKIYPGGWTRQDEVEWTIKDLEKHLRNGWLAIAKVDGEIASIIAYKVGGQLENGTPIYEVTKASTLPQYRERGLYRELRDLLTEQIEETHGQDLPFVTSTKSATVIRRITELGWKKILFEDYLRMAERAGVGWTEEMIERGQGAWKAFVFDPSGKHSDQIRYVNEATDSQPTDQGLAIPRTKQGRFGKIVATATTAAALSGLALGVFELGKGSTGTQDNRPRIRAERVIVENFRKSQFAELAKKFARAEEPKIKQSIREQLNSILYRTLLEAGDDADIVIRSTASVAFAEDSATWDSFADFLAGFREYKGSQNPE